MRRANVIIAPAIIILFVIHAIAGAYQVMGIYPGGVVWLQRLGWLLLVLIGVHVLIGCVLTLQTLKAQRRSGVLQGRGRVAYLRANALFWTRRLSGFAMLILIVVHVLIFIGRGSGTAYRLSFFGPVELSLQLLLVACLIVHLISNVRPSLIGLGIPKTKGLAGDIMIVLSCVLLFSAIGFVIYFLRWLVV